MTTEHLTVVTRKGQITVPAPVRLALRLKEGDRVAVSVREGEECEALLRPVRSIVEATYGIAASRGQVADDDAVREAIEQGLVEDALRGMRPADGPA